MKILLLVHVTATLILFGVILVVQVVHYPLFEKVGAAGFAAYQAAHMRLITFVVALPMVVELGTALALAVWRPFDLPAWQVWTGVSLVGVIWLSTGLLQVPSHNALLGGFEASAHQRLVATNWIRTAAWGARAVLVLAMLAPLLKDPRGV